MSEITSFPNLSTDPYEPSADEIMQQTQEFKDHLSIKNVEPDAVAVWRDKVFVAQENKNLLIFGRVSADDWRLIETVTCGSVTDANETCKSIKLGSQDPLELI